MSILSEQARAFREMSDHDCRELLNGRITLEEVVAKNIRRTPEQITDALFDEHFFTRPEDSPLGPDEPYAIVRAMLIAAVKEARA